ncbi:phage tail tape measure protein [Elizabethkingia sp. HX WHF]|uniref:phage tail tape measure protein n=1 Tax=Elizabethkingia TaxID=308865 RepID=UPI000CE9495D|nr:MULTISPECIES: phage tail tape measure protein [Elizabethkingia]AVF49378.1 phage tail tape measure protein [Elizabethkingia anophelis]AVF53373.1 phage tail tape measure protein [Elizabethkingia anophelis]MDX8566285.1 phage tail tape measure protein [Elizabethkingia sp. HX WHF]
MATSKLQMLIDLSSKLFNDKWDKVQKRWSDGVDKMKGKLKGLEDKIPGLGKLIENLKTPAAIAGAAIMALWGVTAKATMMANDWHVKMAEINVTAGLSQKELRGLSDELLDVGARNVAPLEEIPKAFGRIISAGLDVNQSMQALEPTLRAAKAGFTDIETVASAGIATMMSSGKDINRVYDVLFETVKEGNAEFKDIARYMPKIVPLARSIGYELEGAAGAFASLTTKLSAEQSTTALEGIMRTLSNADVAMGKVDKKTGKYASGFRAIGINIFDSAGKIRPLIDIVQELNKAMNGLTDEQKVQKLSKLGFDQSTALGFGTLMQDIDGLKKATEATTGAQGSLNQAYMDSLTPMEQYAVIQNNMKASMIKLGERVLPYVTSALEKLTPVFQWIYQNIDTLIPLIGTFIGVLGGLSAAVWAVNIAMYANPVTLIIAAVAAAIAIVTVAIVKYNEWGGALLMLLGPIGVLISGIKKIYDSWGLIKQAFATDGILGALNRIGLALADSILHPLEQIFGMMSKLPGKMGAAFTNMQRGLNEFRQNTGMAPSDKLIKKAEWDKYAKMGLKSEGDIYAYLQKQEEAKKKTEVPKELGSLYGTKGGLFSNTPGGNPKDKKKLKDDVNKVTGEAKQVKNITVNIDSLNKGGINMNGNSAAGMSLQDVENWFNEAMMRIMRNVETS